MMTMIDPSIAVRLRSSVSGFCCSAPFPYCRPTWCSDENNGIQALSRRFFHCGALETPWNRFPGKTNGCFIRRHNLISSRVRAAAEQWGSGSDHMEQNGKPLYHPCEDISKPVLLNEADARLTDAETSRTIVEVNSKATLMFSGLVDEDIHHNIFWPELPYLTDEHGNIYFQVSSDEDIMESLTSDNNYVQVIVGLDTLEMIKEMELSGPADIDFGIDELEDQNSDTDGEEDDDDDDDEEDGYESDWVAVLDEDEDDGDSDEALGDWAKLETMRSTHPIYFAKKLAEVTSDGSVDWMEQSPAGLAIQGLLRPVVIEEHSVIQKHVSDLQSTNGEEKRIEELVNENSGSSLSTSLEDKLGSSEEDSSTGANEPEKDESRKSGTSFYKLEMIKIQFISAHGHQTVVDVEDFKKARADAIANSANKIISRLKDGGEKTTQALKSLCWRLKGLQVEEATLIGIDSLGFDLRVCAGTQVQTLRFGFTTRATSEYSAERQLNDILFPRTHPKLQQKQPRQKEC